MSLVRLVVRHTFVLLHRKQWSDELVQAHVDVLRLVAVNGSEPKYRGVVMHVADLFVDELLAAPQNAGPAAAKQVLATL